MKDQIISTVRIGIASLVGFILTWLITNNLIDPDIEKGLQSLIETLSVVVGTTLYYAIARLLETKFPWLLILLNPTTPKAQILKN